MEDNLAQQLYAAYQKTGVKMYRSAGEEITRLRERLAEADECNRRVSDENEKLRHELITSSDAAKYYDYGYSCARDMQKDEITRLRAENEKLSREAAIRLDQIEREQEAHLKTIADFNKQAEMNGRLLTENAELREALKPFAYYASQIPNDVSDTASASGTVGDLRAVAAVMKELGE